jgi:tRNA G26 N,N-dimethylase Trm1
MSIETCIENYINGNLQDSKKQAKKYKVIDLIQELTNYGFNSSNSHAIASYLKNKMSWDELNNSLTT